MIHTNRIRAAYPFTIITTNSIPMTAFQVNHRRTPHFSSSACSWNGIRGNGLLLASFYSCPRNNGIKASKEAPCTDHKHLNHPVISSFFSFASRKGCCSIYSGFLTTERFQTRQVVAPNQISYCSQRTHKQDNEFRYQSCCC